MAPIIREFNDPVSDKEPDRLRTFFLMTVGIVQHARLRSLAGRVLIGSVQETYEQILAHPRVRRIMILVEKTVAEGEWLFWTMLAEAIPQAPRTK